MTKLHIAAISGTRKSNIIVEMNVSLHYMRCPVSCGDRKHFLLIWLHYLLTAHSLYFLFIFILNVSAYKLQRNVRLKREKEKPQPSSAFRVTICMEAWWMAILKLILMRKYYKIKAPAFISLNYLLTYTLPRVSVEWRNGVYLSKHLCGTTQMVHPYTVSYRTYVYVGLCSVSAAAFYSEDLANCL